MKEGHDQRGPIPYSFVSRFVEIKRGLGEARDFEIFPGPVRRLMDQDDFVRLPELAGSQIPIGPASATL